MGIFSTLHREHILIKEQLSLLAAASDLISTKRNPPREFFDKSLMFAHTYTNQHHHYKEEYLLFTYLANRSDGRLDETLKKLRSQHEIAQNHLTELANSLDGYEQGEQASVSNVHRHLTEFVRLMELHIFAEDAVFFRMAKEMLDEKELDVLQEGFTRYEQGLGEDPTPACKQLLNESRTILEEMESSSA
jgi:hemerythrin-like domain-containing protein